MKKILALLASLLMASSCMALSASAEYVVVAVNDQYPVWVLRDADTHPPMFYYPENPLYVDCFYMSPEEIADFNPSQETFEFGDIIGYENLILNDFVEDFGTRSPFWYSWEVIKEDQPYSIFKVGSILDNPETKQFTVTGHDGSIALFLRDDDGNHYEYLYDWLVERDDYHQPDSVDVSVLHRGDVVTCIIYDGNPMLVTEIISSAPPSGDANNDGTLDILDVILVNKAILGKKYLNIDQIYHTDFNQDGMPDASDSLTMLKMIVGLE